MSVCHCLPGRNVVARSVVALLAGLPKHGGVRQAVPSRKSSVFRHFRKQWHTRGDHPLTP